MKTSNYNRIGKMLDYINGRKEKVEPLELIAIFVPSVYDLNIVYNKTLKGKYHDIRIDTSCKKIKGLIKKTHELKEKDGFNSEERLRYLRGKK